MYKGGSPLHSLSFSGLSIPPLMTPWGLPLALPKESFGLLGALRQQPRYEPEKTLRILREL